MRRNTAYGAISNSAHAPNLPAAPAIDPALMERIEAMERRLERLEQGRGPRDHADRALVGVLAVAAAGLPFRAGDVMKLAERVPELHEALEAADITSARQLGKLLSRLRGVDIDGICLARIGARRGGALWRCVHVSQM